MNEQDAMNRMAEGYCDGLALTDVEDPARYRQAAEQGGLLALHDEMSARRRARPVAASAGLRGDPAAHGLGRSVRPRRHHP